MTAESHRLRIAAATTAALCAFAANSILCRLALGTGRIDAATFTLLRLASGAALLAPLAWARRGARAQAPPAEGVEPRPPWPSALLLFAYAAGFSLAYVTLPAGVGALLLFGAVQATMLAAALRAGERVRAAEAAGLATALAGMVVLTAPGARAPSLVGAALMVAAGIAWGLYTLRGRGDASDPLGATSRNFVASVPAAAALALFVALIPCSPIHVTGAGALLAVVSGALTSGLGYVIWYAALRGLTAVRASIVQLAVPVLAAGGGVLFLGERLSWRLAIAALLILGGVGWAVRSRRPDDPARA